MNEIITIIIPIYNTEKRLERCINSVILQTYSNLDIILIDDGSTDNSGYICDRFKERDNRIKVIHKKNEGVSIARNYGLTEAKGKFVMFLDSDDYLDKDICYKLLSFSEKNNCDIAITNKVFHINNRIVENVLYSEDEVVRSNHDKDIFLLDLFSKKYDDKINNVKYLSCGVTAKLFNLNLIKENNIKFLENCHYGEDVLFNLYAYQKATKIGYIRYNGYHFIVNSNSSTHKYKNYWEDSHKMFIESISNFIKIYNKDRRFLESLDMMRVTRISGLAVSYYFHYDNNKKFYEKYNEFIKFINQPEYKKSIKLVKFKLLTDNQKLIALLLKLKLFIIVAIIATIKSNKERCKNE